MANTKNKLNPFIDQFFAEVETSLLLSDDDKIYWQKNARHLPLAFLKNMYAMLKSKNELVSIYLDKALEKNPDIVVKLKNKVKTMKKEILNLKEKSEKDDNQLEKLLASELKKL